MADCRRQSPLPTIVAMLLASAGVHLMLWPLGNEVISHSWGAPPIHVGGGVMEVALVPMDGGEEDEPEEESAKDKEPEDAEENSPIGKLVNLEWLFREQAPKNAEFVSEFDSSVDRQTRAPTGTPGSPVPTSDQPGDRPDATQSRLQMLSSSLSQALSLSPQRGLADGGQGEGSADSLTSMAPDGTMSGDPGRAAAGGVPGLRGSPDAMRRTFGEPGTYDDLRGLEEGQETLLNSRRWKYASFFNRVRDAVAQHWHPEVVHASRDPEGRIYGSQTRVTRLRIALNPDGSLHRIRIETPSGVDYLDEEAIRAVRAAHPFNNPPPQLVDESGRISFDFGFIFEIKGRNRIFRYRR